MSHDILIVDDNADIRSALHDILTTLDIKVRSAENGADALIQMMVHLPGLIVLDLEMPVLDGFRVLEEIRVNPNASGIPVLVFTSHPITPALAEEVGLPLNMIVAKGSLSMTELRDTVVRAMNQP